MHVSPVLSAQGTYPFVRIERAKREAAEAGIAILDFGQGDPREPTDPLIRQALVDGLRERMGYPKAEGLPELRQAIAGWCERRFGARLDPDAEIVPTYGSKEAIFSFAQVVVPTIPLAVRPFAAWNNSVAMLPREATAPIRMNSGMTESE